MRSCTRVVSPAFTTPLSLLFPASPLYCLCSSNYLDALMAVYNESQSLDIPYKVVLLDSWWYYKGIGDGVKNWTAMPSTFPGGNAGIRELTAATGWKIIAHNRYWWVQLAMLA